MKMNGWSRKNLLLLLAKQYDFKMSQMRLQTVWSSCLLPSLGWHNGAWEIKSTGPPFPFPTFLAKSPQNWKNQIDSNFTEILQQLYNNWAFDDWFEGAVSSINERIPTTISNKWKTRILLYLFLHFSFLHISNFSNFLDDDLTQCQSFVSVNELCQQCPTLT